MEMASSDRYAVKQRDLHCYTPLPAPCLWQLFTDRQEGVCVIQIPPCRCREAEGEWGGLRSSVYLIQHAAKNMLKSCSHTQRVLQTASQLHYCLHHGRKISSFHCVLECLPLPFREGLNAFHNTTQDLPLCTSKMLLIYISFHILFGSKQRNSSTPFSLYKIDMNEDKMK